MRTQTQKLFIAHWGEHTIGVKRAIKPAIVSHPGEHTARHALRIKESGRVAEGDSLSSYPRDPAAAANERIKCAVDGGLEVESSRPDDDRHFPRMDAPAVTMEVKRFRLRLSHPGVSREADVLPCVRCGQSVGDEPWLLVASDEDRQCVSNEWRGHGTPHILSWFADGTNDDASWPWYGPSL